MFVRKCLNFALRNYLDKFDNDTEIFAIKIENKNLKIIVVPGMLNHHVAKQILLKIILEQAYQKILYKTKKFSKKGSFSAKVRDTKTYEIMIGFHERNFQISKLTKKNLIALYKYL